MATATVPYQHLGEALATDYFMVREQFTDEQWGHFIEVRRFVDQEVLPAINEYWEAAELPWPLMRRLAELGLFGEDIKGHGCPGMSPLTRGLVNMELHRGDGSLGTFLGVQSGLAMKSIDALGSEEQKEHWLPAMARLDAVGAFALTEPMHGSDSVALETTARRDGDDWVLDGAKRWIGNGSIADVVVVWARSDEDGQVKGFLVERGWDGFEAATIEGKGAARAIWQADIRLDGVRVPETSRLPGGAELQGHRPRARYHADDVRLGRARPRRRGVRHRAHLQQAAHAVRQAAVLVPDRPGAARADARGGDEHAALLHAARAPGGIRPAHRHHRRPGQAQQHPQGARGDRFGARHARRQRRPAREPRHPPHGRHRGHPHLRGHRDHADADRRARHHRRGRFA